MPNLDSQLELERCPHCNIDKPNLQAFFNHTTSDYLGKRRTWSFYVCARCGGVVSAWANQSGNPIRQIFPESKVIDESIPHRAKNYLEQALNSLHAPAGAIMLAASAIDAMLKSAGYTKNSLYNRINQAAKDHLITKGMSQWAHQVRLDANEQRHSDENSGLPDSSEASKTIDFALALAEFLFVLPSRVKKGLRDSSDNNDQQAPKIET